MRDLLKNDPENADAEKLGMHEGVKRKCQEVYSDAEDYQICIRTAKAGHDMARAFEYQQTKVEQTEWMFFRELPVVAVTNTAGYPTRACRAETAFQGAICNKGPDYPITYTSEAMGVCHEANGDTFGMRPSCWFKSSL